MKQTASPTLAGILGMISGVLSLTAAAAFLIGSVALGWAAVDITGWVPGMDIAFGVTGMLALVFLAAGVVALIGGVCAIQRRRWGWALAGAFCALLPTLIVGFVAVTLVAVSRDEFEQMGSALVVKPEASDCC
jgi:hypothetical protein